MVDLNVSKLPGINVLGGKILMLVYGDKLQTLQLIQLLMLIHHQNQFYKWKKSAWFIS